MKINRKLIWDYQFTPAEMERESFKRWYLARVLTRGGSQDLRDAGLENVHRYFPKLFLPRKIGAFWEWYFSLPEVKERYGNINPPSEEVHS